MTAGDPIYFATCTEVPDGDPDDRLAIDELARCGLVAEPRVWDDATVDWSAAALTVLRSTWDYSRRAAQFVDWACRVPRLANPPAVVEWNVDKRYLLDLIADGIATVPTTIVEPWSDEPTIARSIDAALERSSIEGVVVKPAVGAGSRGAAAFRRDGERGRDAAIDHAGTLIAAGRGIVVQPYQPAIDDGGELAAVCFAGTFSHAARKAPILDPDAGAEWRAAAEEGGELYVVESMSAATADAEQVALAERAVAAAAERFGGLLYARVDLIADDAGAPQVLELELVEPSLFMGYAPGAATRFAAAIASRLSV